MMIISDELGNALIQYLVKQPYGEVAGLIAMISKENNQKKVVTEEVKSDKEENKETNES